jgi:hypothetical protein
MMALTTGAREGRADYGKAGMMRGLIGAAILAGMLLLGGGRAVMAEEAAAAAAAEASAAAAPAEKTPAKGDDFAALIGAAAPPERFKDHVPKFSVKEEEFEFQTVIVGEKPAAGEAEKTPGIGIFDKPSEKGKPADKGKAGKAPEKPSDRSGAAEKAGPQPGKAKLWIVRDGLRVVAVYHAKASKLYLVASDPAKADEKVDLPPGYSDSGGTFDGRLGVRLTTFPPCYGPTQAGEHIFAFTPGKKGLTLGLVDTTRWPGRKGAEAVYALTLRCDPVLGYVVDCDVDFKADAAKDEAGKPLDPELMGFFPPHVYMQKWPDAAWRYEYTIYAPAGDEKTPAEGRYVGWVNDFGQSDRARGLRLRSGGFTLYAADPDGAGPALAATAGEGTLLRLDTGNLTFDQHYRATLPAKPDAAGAYGVKARLRYATLPPEVVRLAMERMEVTDFRGSPALPIKVGRTEGAEDEAALLKASLVYKELPITDREHHTGAKSLMIVGGRQIRLDPSPPLEPGATYRVEAWVKVTGYRGGEARLAALPAKWVPKGTEAAQQLSASVKPEEGWKPLIMKFTSGLGGSTPWLYLVVSRNVTAYLDDVTISKIEKMSN